MKKKTIFTGGKKTAGVLFQGEMMTCKMCGRQQKSDPKVESNWTALQFDSLIVYLCPSCFRKLERSTHAHPF